DELVGAVPVQRVEHLGPCGEAERVDDPLRAVAEQYRALDLVEWTGAGDGLGGGGRIGGRHPEPARPVAVRAKGLHVPTSRFGVLWRAVAGAVHLLPVPRADTVP